MYKGRYVSPTCDTHYAMPSRNPVPKSKSIVTIMTYLHLLVIFY